MRKGSRILLGLSLVAAIAIGITGLMMTPETMSAPPDRQFCGGIAGFPCPEGYVCVDDPTDDCNPRKGGADCGGYCKRHR